MDREATDNHEIRLQGKVFSAGLPRSPCLCSEMKGALLELFAVLFWGQRGATF